MKPKNYPSLSHLKNLLFLVLLLYFSIGIFLGTTKYSNKWPGRKEVFPFFSWFLFVKVPQDNRTDYSIIIHKYNGQEIKPGLPLEKADSSMIDKPYANARMNNLLRKMGLAYKRNKLDEFEKYKNIFEKNYINGEIKYELIEEKYSLLERYSVNQPYKIRKKSIIFLQNY